MRWADAKAGAGTVAATLALISDHEARSLAGLFVDIEGELAHAIIEAQSKSQRWGVHH